MRSKITFQIGPENTSEHRCVSTNTKTCEYVLKPDMNQRVKEGTSLVNNLRSSLAAGGVPKT